MITTVLEIRDDGTFISALAIQMKADNEVAGGYIYAREGHPIDGRSITLMRLSDKRAHNDPYEWSDRTHQTAHLYIEAMFDKLKDGDVVDVEFILGERDAPKVTERPVGRPFYIDGSRRPNPVIGIAGEDMQEGDIIQVVINGPGSGPDQILRKVARTEDAPN